MIYKTNIRLSKK